MRQRSCNGCGTPTEGAYCPRCAPSPRRSPSSRVSSHQRAKAKARRFRRHPICECCERAPSEELHNIVAVSTAPELAYTDGNVLALCGPCHRLAYNRGATLAELQGRWARVRLRR